MAKRPTAKKPDPRLRKRAHRILETLGQAYPEARCALGYETPLDLYVATVLSAQCTDVRVNQVTPALFASCRRAEDYLSLGQERLEDLIRSTGFFRNKAKSILAGCRRILEVHGGELPRTMAELVLIPGVGRKTANVLLGNVFGTPGITVDTHVQRLSHRLGLTDERDPVKIEFALMPLFPEASWTELSHRLILHGRAICRARKPACDVCPLRADCPFPSSSEAKSGAASRSKPRPGGAVAARGGRSPSTPH